MKKIYVILSSLISISLFSCNHGDKSFITWNNKNWLIKEGESHLNLNDGWLKLGNHEDFIVTIESKYTDLEDGLYYLTLETQNQGNQDYSYVYTINTSQEEKRTSFPRSINNETNIVTVRGIEVKNNTLNIGITSKGKNTCSLIKNLKLIKENNQSKKYTPLLGGAISWLDWEEDMGAKYYDEDGREKDALLILKENGCNFVRLELYNNPGQYIDPNGNYFPSKYKNQDSILELAKRANALDMEIQLSFMYSDYWGNEAIPADWKEELENIILYKDKINYLNEKIYEWTTSFMNRLKEENIYPKYVSIGNEIDSGFLLPYGSLFDSEESAKALYSFISSGYKAVKEVSPSSQVVLHLASGSNNDMFWENQIGIGKTFFQMMKDNDVNYDVIGCSYYPFWAQNDSPYAVKRALDLSDLKSWCELMIDTFDKNVLIMETAINWGTPGQLANNGAYEGIYPYSQEGQRDYLLDMVNTMKSIKDGRCVGVLYWDPIFVRQENIGYALYDNGKVRENVIETTTLFDYNHKLLPAINAFKYN